MRSRPGKTALPPAVERTSHGRRGSAQAEPAGVTPAPAQSAPPVVVAPRETAPLSDGSISCRSLARARRARISQSGRGASGESAPVRPERRGAPDSAPQADASTPDVRGVSPRPADRKDGAAVTGVARNPDVHVSGTGDITSAASAALSSNVPKVGLARTAGGAVVSGTLVRSGIRVTGDEAGGGIAVTGESDQTPADDLTPRATSGSFTSSQFLAGRARSASLVSARPAFPHAAPALASAT